MLYQIPASAQPEDIRIAGWFGYWGTAVWYLTKKEISQDNMERYRIMESEVMQIQKNVGQRISDRQSERGRA
jgi:hypothetical protein